LTTLTMMVGLPCSGKSTYCEQVTDTVLHMDEIRKAVTGSYRINDLTRSHYYKVCQDSVRHFLEHGIDVVLDGALLSRSARSPYIKIAKQFHANVEVIWFDPPLDIIEARLSKRNKVVQSERQIALSYVKRIAHDHFQIPLVEEGIHSIIHKTDFGIY
jgi:predicted kinase